VPDVYDLIVIDGEELMHSIPSTSVHGMTFDSHFYKV